MNTIGGILAVIGGLFVAAVLVIVLLAATGAATFNPPGGGAAPPPGQVVQPPPSQPAPPPAPTCPSLPNIQKCTAYGGGKFVVRFNSPTSIRIPTNYRADLHDVKRGNQYGVPAGTTFHEVIEITLNPI